MIYRWLVTFSDLCAGGGEMAGPSGGLVPHELSRELRVARELFSVTNITGVPLNFTPPC